MALLREAQAALQPDYPDSADKLKQLITRLLMEEIPYFEDVLSECVARADGLSVLALLYTTLPQTRTGLMKKMEELYATE